jgi:voltage-gated potassium channel
MNIANRMTSRRIITGMKDYVADLLDGNRSRAARIVQVLIVAAIVTSVIAMILETVPGLSRYDSLFDHIELVCALLFTTEILLRLWSAPAAASPFAQRRWPRIAYLMSPSGVVDLVSVVPFYFGGSNFMVVRSLRLLRVFRLAKLVRYVAALSLLRQAIRMRRRELIALGLVAAITILISATLMYSAEHEAQPKAFACMPDALWWALSTLTTVGYGDIYPTTPLGRLCASLIMILGIGLVALPTGLVGSAFYELTQHRVCPHCGCELISHPSHLKTRRSEPTSSGGREERSAGQG